MNPWSDFFNVYLDLGYALHGHIAAKSPETAKELDDLLKAIREHSNDEEVSDFNRSIVHAVVAQFRGKSRDILYQNPEYFNQPLFLFPAGQGFIDVNVAEVWRQNKLFQQGLWQYIEQLYVIGNVCLHPNRKDKFLKIVRQLKREANPAAGPPEDEEDIAGVVQGISQMMGLGDNPAMGELMTDLAKQMHQTMSQTDDPMALLQSMMSGDMSALGDMQQSFERKITAKIETGELSEADFQQSREGMAANFGGMEGLMQLASGLGLQAPPQQPLQPASQQPPPPQQRATKQRIKNHKPKTKGRKKKKK